MEKLFLVLPMELSEENAKDLFLGSAARKNARHLTQVVLFPKESGFSEDSAPLIFDTAQVSMSKYVIAYMLGQLHEVHEGKRVISTKSIAYNYKKEPWISDTSALMSFLHLALAADLISAVNANNLTIELSPLIEPTYDKTMPNFDAWFRSYKERMKKIILEQESVEIKID